MRYVGFDVSRDRADYAVLTRSLNTKTQSGVPNDTEDIIAVLQPLVENRGKMMVGVESTAMYHLPVVEACSALNIPCRLLNPLLTKEFLKSSIRKRKTDREDAVVIAKLVAQEEGTPVHIEHVKDELKALVRSACRTVRMAQSLNMHIRHMKRIMDVPLCLSQEEERLRDIAEELKHEAMDRAPAEMHRLLRSIPGIGHWTATVVLGELGDMKKYHSGAALVAASGLDPRVRQSGALLKQTGRLTKRGSPHLRCALFCAAHAARMSDPELKEYYERKRLQGKSYKVATCATARKLLYRIYAVSKRGTSYEPAENV